MVLQTKFSSFVSFVEKRGRTKHLICLNISYQIFCYSNARQILWLDFSPLIPGKDVAFANQTITWASKDVDSIIDQESTGISSSILHGSQLYPIPLNKINLLYHTRLLGFTFIPPEYDDPILLARYHSQILPGCIQAYFKQSPLILANVIQLDYVGDLQVGVHTTCYYYLIFIDCTSWRIHNVEEHRS